MAFSVYMHVLPDGKRYVGLTSIKPSYRFNYGRGYKGNKQFYAAIQFFGWENIRHEIVAEGLTEEEACDLEIKLIAEYKCTDPRYGYNKSRGGQKGCSGVKYTAERLQKIIGANNPMYGRHMSDETKRRISEAKKGRSIWSEEARNLMSINRRGEKSPRWGKHFTPEQRAKMSVAQKGKRTGKDNSWSRAVLKIGPNGEILQKYGAAKEAARDVGVDPSCIIACCNGKQKTSKGYQWRYEKQRNS